MNWQPNPKSVTFSPGIISFGTLFIASLVLVVSIVSYAITLNSDIARIEMQTDLLTDRLDRTNVRIFEITGDVGTNSMAIERIDTNLEYIKNYIENNS